MVLENRNFEIAAAASLLGWWRDAGVDTAVGEIPHDWMGVAVASDAKTSAIGELLSSKTFQSLDTFIDYLMTGDVSDAGPPKRRVRPSGDPASGLMILVDFPDIEDVESGQSLSDPIFDKMLAALGHDRHSAYVATLCPGRPMTGRLSEASIDALAILARQHIAFVSPKQLWMIGGAASRAILGIDDAAARGQLHKVNQSGIIMNAIATAHPRMFGGSKSRKAAAWIEMQRLVVKEDV